MSGYDEHQRLRTKAVRLLSKKNYSAAITLLHEGSVKMLKASEQGSGCDLAIYLVDVYGQAGVKPDAESRNRLVEIIQLAKADFWRKKLLDAVVKWTASAGEDVILRHEIAKLLAKEGSYSASEPHFHAALPGPSSPPLPPAEGAAADLGRSMVDWLANHAQKTVEEQKKANASSAHDAALVERVEAGRFALRGLVLLLQAGKVSAAHIYLESFLSALFARPACKNVPISMPDNPSMFEPPAGVTVPKSKEQQQRQQKMYATGSADLNFAQMCLGLVDCSYRIKGEAAGLLASAKGAAPAPQRLQQVWITVVRQYAKEGIACNVDQLVGEGLNTLSSLYFDLQAPQQQGNMMADMMASLFGGGAPAAGAPAGPQGAKFIPYKKHPEPTILTEEEEQEEEQQQPKPSAAAPSVALPEEDLD